MNDEPEMRAVGPCVRSRWTSLALSVAFAALLLTAASAIAQPLPSRNDRPAGQPIVEFVTAVTSRDAPTFVPLEERIAVFDNDGRLWSEQPLYFQFVFMLDQVKAAAPSHPEWKNNPAFEALVAHDTKKLAEPGQKPILELMAVANSCMTGEAYDRTIPDWLSTARPPKYQRQYAEIVYVPMQKLLGYLREKGFKTFIVSGGSVEFMHPWVEKACAIPPEQVIGSQQDVKLEIREGKSVLTRAPKVAFIDDGPSKPVGICRGIGRRPIAAVGKSDGDQQMLEVTADGPGSRLIVLVPHDDAEREFAYDRESRIGRIDKAWD